MVIKYSEPPDCADEDGKGLFATQISYTDRIDGNISRAFPSAPPTSSGGSDLGHHCTEIITLRLRMLSVSGGLPGSVPII